MKLHRGPQIRVDRERVAAMLKEGRTTVEIAERLDCSRKTVSAIKRELATGIRKPHAKPAWQRRKEAENKAASPRGNVVRHHAPERPGLPEQLRGAASDTARRRLTAPGSIAGSQTWSLKARTEPYPQPRPVPIDPLPALVSETNGEPSGKRSVLMADLDARGCRFAVTPIDARPHLFCNAPQEAGCPYCAEHRKRAWSGTKIAAGSVAA